MRRPDYCTDAMLTFLDVFVCYGDTVQHIVKALMVSFDLAPYEARRVYYYWVEQSH